MSLYYSETVRVAEEMNLEKRSLGVDILPLTAFGNSQRYHKLLSINSRFLDHCRSSPFAFRCKSYQYIFTHVKRVRGFRISLEGKMNAE
jgi:hypothetical protein